MFVRLYVAFEYSSVVLSLIAVAYCMSCLVKPFSDSCWYLDAVSSLSAVSTSFDCGICGPSQLIGQESDPLGQRTFCFS